MQTRNQLKIPRHILLLLLLAITVGGCSKLRRSWTKEGYTGDYYAKIAVIGLSESPVERADFEEFSVGLLVGREINAVAGTALLTSSLETFDSAIRKEIAKSDLDGILIIDLVSSSESVLPEEYNKFSKFYSHRFTDLNTQRYLSSNEKYTMEAYLYNFKDKQPEGTLVWKGKMAILDPNNVEVKHRFMRRMVNELVEDKLLRKKLDQLTVGTIQSKYQF